MINPKQIFVDEKLDFTRLTFFKKIETIVSNGKND